MSYLVDGNNLMSRSQTRRELLDELAAIAAARKIRVTVVFDGAPENNFPDGSTFKSVKVFYSKFGSNADERIKNFVEASKERRTLFVVTDDRQLADYIRKSGAKITACNEFRSRMNPSETIRETKPTAIKQEELGEWMRYFGVDESDE
jgi:predicted RNA-binding protein with PIN domain